LPPDNFVDIYFERLVISFAAAAVSVTFRAISVVAACGS